LILGDSLAVGVGQVRTECVTYARSGINSYDYVNRHILYTKSNHKEAKTVIISLGANDHAGVKTERELRRMREAIRGQRVFWIDPGQDRKPVPHAAIVKIAQEYGDTILPRPREHMSADGIHPTGRGYRVLADNTR